MSRIPQSFIDDLIARADIVEIVGARVQLKKAGREYKACCPFHTEKTPSFWVSPEKQFYHCFGCGAHGTALGFLMQHDRLSFPEAIEELATRLGVEVPREAQVGAPRRTDDSQFELMMRVARFYAERLASDPRARAYVATRGLTRESLDGFLIGYAPSSWNEVLQRFGGTDTARSALAELGLIVERERGTGRDGERHYDRFRDRLMFPIRDARGRVIGFGGRVIGDGEPKYLNSPETPLFHKGRELYGLYETRQARAPLKQLLIVEGYMDAVRVHQAGITYAVATLGTATTDYHLKRIFKLVSQVVFAFDGDRAGRAAAWRALQIALPEAREGREIRFLFLPEGHDPDSLVAEEGREAFERRIAGGVPLSEYLARELESQTDLTHADGRARFAEAARPLLARVPAGVFRELLMARVAETVRLSPERLEELWTAGSAAEAYPARPVARARASTGTSAGRGSLMRQAIAALVNHPSIAASVGPELRAALDRVDQRGIDVLRQLLDDLRARPAVSSGQLIERWNEQPERKQQLSALVESDALVPDPRARTDELVGALEKLIEASDAKRFEELRAKSELGTLSEAELKEFQRLTIKARPPGASP
ncbi:MAG: DNA primase [Gammaproteobacteria bacterium]